LILVIKITEIAKIAEIAEINGLDKLFSIVIQDGKVYGTIVIYETNEGL